MKTLVWVEHDNASLKTATLSAVTAAAAMGTVDLLVAGHACRAVADAGAAIPGVVTVHLVDHPACDHALAENIAPLVAMLMADHDAFVAPATTTGRDIAPRVAALLDVMQVSDILSVEGPRVFTRPIYAGSAIATVESLDAKLVVTVRATAFDDAPTSGGTAAIVETPFGTAGDLSRFVRADVAATDRPELASAGIVVSGGRALKDADTFAQIILPLADRLGAAVGASRAAVDAGFVSNDHQVGQTGKIVAPGLYIAIGISGAIQHLAGMKDSKTIVAINRDADAPIFQIADIGLVADLFDAVPDLTARL